jgi:tetratricopeptide (TPR) repeat protein
LWKQECRDSSSEAFIFPNARKRNGAKKNGFVRTDNYRARVLKKLAEKLGLAKLNLQVLRRTMATLAQKKGGVKDVQGILGHSKADTTVNVYMQEIEESVRQTQDAIYRGGDSLCQRSLGICTLFTCIRTFCGAQLSPMTNNALAMPYYFSRQYDQVIATCKSILKTQGEPGFWITHVILGYAYEAKRERDLALHEFRKGVNLSAGDPDTLGALGHAYAISGDRRAAVAIIRELKKASAARYVPRFDVAIIFLGLGDTSGAFALFEQGYAEHNSDLAYYFRFDPRLDSVRSDVRFKSLMERLRLPDSSANLAATPFVKDAVTQAGPE